MAKGDDSRSRNQIDAQGGLAQNHLNNLRNDTLIPQNQSMWNDYTRSRESDTAALGNVNKNFQNFADTGGFSPLDKSQIRSRAVSPLRAIYSNANREVDRSRALQGGYSPGYGVLKARMAREQGSAMSDASQNTEGMIAQMVNQGKQFGSEGLLSAYGTTPGLSNMTSRNALESTSQRLQGEQQQQNLGLGIMGAQIDASKLPGKGEYVSQRIGQGLNLGAAAMYPWLDPTSNLAKSVQGVGKATS